MVKLSNSFQILINSAWPFIISIILFDYFLSLVSIFYNIIYSNFLFYWSSILLIISLFWWFKEIIFEGVYKGEFSKKESYNLIIGFILFVISEIIIFFILFFSFLYNSIIPSIDIGCLYPPLGLNIINSYSLPILNSALLYFSGLTLSISQNYLYFRSKSYSLFYLFITIILAFIFSAIQLFEYLHSSFSIYDSIYATNFYILTGFHGIHVIIGSSLLLMSFFKLFFNHFIMSPSNLVAFHSSAIYWAFVDYAWIAILALIYIWGS